MTKELEVIKIKLQDVEVLLIIYQNTIKRLINKKKRLVKEINKLINVEKIDDKD